MTFLQGLLKAVPSMGGLARRAWCQGQRRRLAGLASQVLWVAPPARWSALLRETGRTGRLEVLVRGL